MSDKATFEEMPAPEGMEHIGELVEDMPLVVKESKAGYKTTEFWAFIAISILTQLNGIPMPEKYEGFVMAALAAAYVISRGIAKNGVAHVAPAD